MVEVLENLAFLANASNLVTYLMGFMHYSPSQSATAVTNFMGTAFLLALLGGFLSDAFFTTYTIYIASAFIELMVRTHRTTTRQKYPCLIVSLMVSCKFLLSCITSWEWDGRTRTKVDNNALVRVPHSSSYPIYISTNSGAMVRNLQAAKLCGHVSA